MRFNCPACKVGVFERVVTDNGSANPNRYITCSVCGAVYLDFEPLPYQETFLKDKHLIKAFFGGYASGKTVTCSCAVAVHMLTVPHGKTIVLAQTLSQLEQTAIPTIMSFIPDHLIRHSYKKPFSIMLWNGHELVAMASDDEQKLRSLQSTCYYAIEASGIKHDIITQLDARNRHPAGYVYARNKNNEIVFKFGKPVILKDNHLGIIESNPDMGYIRDKILFTADKIYGRDASKYNVADKDKNPNLSVHIAVSYENPYVSDSFITQLKCNKPHWWVKRYLEGSFEYSEGAVYPDFTEHVVEPFPIPDQWERLFGADFGRLLCRSKTLLTLSRVCLY